MHNADEIITNLEAGNVTSCDEIASFFFNTPHDDDHTEELTLLPKKITAINTFIAKMKYRDELAPIYKEYKGKSG